MCSESFFFLLNITMYSLLRSELNTKARGSFPELEQLQSVNDIGFIKRLTNLFHGLC